MSEKPELGQWLTITTYLRKRRRGRNVCWERMTWGSMTSRAMFIGTRQIYDGTIDWGWDEDPTTFTRTTAHNVWLFVLDGKRNPVYVLPEDVQP